MRSTYTAAFVLLLLCTTVTTQAQLSDNFSDGSFKTNPVWSGDTSEFIINAAGELQLNGPEEGASALVTTVQLPYATVWDMKIRLEFAPSLTNLLRIWLSISSLDANAEGYLLDIGENGSADALRFFKRQNGAPTLLATGIPGTVATEPTDIRIVVQRTANGDWTAFVAKDGGPLVQQFMVNDQSMPVNGSKLFGFNCIYTETRKDKFFFDDLVIKADSSDTTPPLLTGYENIDNQKIKLIFDEPLDSLSSIITTQYLLNTTTNPSLVLWSAASPNTVELHFSTPFMSGQNYTIDATAIRDWLGNEAQVQQVAFSFLQETPAAPTDIIINEVMAKPAPSQGLPGLVEWVELLNRSDKYIRLSQLTIADESSTPRPLPDMVLAPDSTIVLCSATGAVLLAPFTNNVGVVVGFPTLNDSGDVIKLANQQGQSIDEISYSDSWHTEAEKSGGGWSLERINPELLCLAAQNWQSCPQLPGGSPGKQNFSFSTAPDVTAPFPVNITLINAQTAQITFSEAMDADALQNAVNYRFTPDLEIDEIVLQTNNSTATLVFTSAIPFKTLYALRFAPTMTDCAGNAVPSDRFLEFGVPENPEMGDLVINEILFNPASGGARFVELYNNSDKILNWNNVYLINTNKTANGIPTTSNRLFLPGTYYVFTTDQTNILTTYPDAVESNIWQQSLPSLDDKTDNISIYWNNGVSKITLDSFNYSSEYHNSLFSVGDREGVSLERIRFDVPTNNSNNWTSAARRGSPTQPNSQASSGQPIQNEFITLQPARISPDGDGKDDYLDIIWDLGQAGYFATLTIYDSEGIPVKSIVKQALASTTGALRWDGDMDNGGRARPGIYILFVELFNAQGDVKRVKLPFAVIF